jgi:glutathione S-transferase/alpha,alpha-trehalase
MFRLSALFILLGLQAIQPSLSFSISSPLGHATAGSTIKATTTTALSSSAGSNNDLILYGHPGTRSPLVNWACLELGIKNLKMGDLSRNPHPFGQLPCLTDGPGGDMVVFESGAILSHLLQNYSPPSLTASARASILSWIMWANASLDPVCFLETNGKVYDTGLKSDNKRIAQLERILAEQGGVLVPDAGFSLADVAVASYLLYVVQFFPQVQLAQKWPNMVQYMIDAASRPAYQQAFGGNTQSEVVGNLRAQQKAAKKLFGMF